LCGPLCEFLRMATNVELDPVLIKEALKLSGKRTKREVIDDALREYVKYRKQKGIIKLFGTIDYDPDYNYKEERRRR
jgi:Arc/MetJ family transcription regulator